MEIMPSESSSPLILGISGSGHDSAAALLKGPALLAAVEEEKLLRVRNPRGLPLRAIRYCLEQAQAGPRQISHVALARPLAGESGERSSGEPWIAKQLKQEFPAAKIVVLDHHLCHAAAAYFPSPFEEAAVLTLDESGDLKTGSLSLARGTALETLEDCYFPDSLGSLYSRVAHLAGFAARGDEHKLQWMSAWGSPIYAPVFRNMLCRESGSLLSLDQSYFEAGRTAPGGFSGRFFQETGLNPKEPLPEDCQAALAASIQEVLEETVLAICRSLAADHQTQHLCLSGGVALNALLVERVESSGLFQGVFVQPAAGNAGNALGAALYCAHSVLGLTPRSRLEHLYYGPSYGTAEIKDVLENCKLRFRYLQTRGELIGAAVAALRQNHILGWFQGRMEFGPRALGARSILASPLGPFVNENLNQYVKHRERFRVFAASVTEEKAAEYFEFGPMARFLATVGRVRPAHRQTFAANLLGEAEAGRSGADSLRIRVHIVDRPSNPLFWDLLEAWGKATGLPVLFNTSFNLFGEPLVCSPRDAVRSFYCSGIDHLAIGNFFISK